MHLENMTLASNHLLAFPVMLENEPMPESAAELGSFLLDHVTDCDECLDAILAGSQPLSESGCTKFQQMLRSEALLPFGPSRPPLTFAHVADEKIDEYCFGRLTGAEARLFEDHIGMCKECAKRVSSEREFIRVMKNILEDMPVITRRTEEAQKLQALEEPAAAAAEAVPARVMAAGR
jgi:hypothetical protein